MLSVIFRGRDGAMGGVSRSWAFYVSRKRNVHSYDAARSAGALGGKILGAGGGGFLLLCVPKPAQQGVREALKGYREIAFGFEAAGSQIVFTD